MVGSLAACCARVPNGHAAALPTRVMNSRRCMEQMPKLILAGNGSSPFANAETIPRLDAWMVSYFLPFGAAHDGRFVENFLRGLLRRCRHRPSHRAAKSRHELPPSHP